VTDHQKLLVAVLSEAADADRSGRRLTPPALMAMLYRLGEQDPSPTRKTPARVTA